MASPPIAPASLGSLTHSPRQLPRASRVWRANDVRAWPTVAAERLLRSTRRYDCSWPVSDRRVRRSRPTLCDYTSVCSAISSASSTSIPTASRVCSVISNCTGRCVFFCITIARVAT